MNEECTHDTLHIHFHILRALKPTRSALQNIQKHRQKQNEEEKTNDHHRNDDNNVDNENKKESNYHNDKKDTRSEQRKHGTTFTRYRNQVAEEEANIFLMTWGELLQPRCPTAHNHIRQLFALE